MHVSGVGSSTMVRALLVPQPLPGSVSDLQLREWGTVVIFLLVQVHTLTPSFMVWCLMDGSASLV